MSLLKWNGDTIGNKSLIKITLDGKNYNFYVTDDLCLPLKDDVYDFRHTTLASGFSFYYTVKLADSKLIVKLKKWPTVSGKAKTHRMSGQRVKIISIAGREVQCQEIISPHYKQNPQ
tara:strand:- start:552 stop:902 length:351 start_codon:yes stop_codon:yes gene_type:complete